MESKRSKASRSKTTITTTTTLKKQSCVEEKGNPFASKYNQFRETQYASPAPYYFNINKVLYDPQMDFSVEEGINGEVSKRDWKCMLANMKQWDKKIASLQLTENPESFSEWVEKVMDSEDASNNKAIVKMRVLNLHEQIIFDSEGKDYRLLKIIAEHANACNDLAVVGLEKAELFAQVRKAGEDLKLNVLVLEFKRHLIATEIVSINSKDAIEDYLFYSIYLNEILMLKNKNQSMDHANWVSINHSFDSMINAIFKRMTVEDLVGFISNHETFQEAYKKAYLAKVGKLMGEMADLDYDDPKVMEVNNQYQTVVSDFYQDKARDLLLEKGFITEDVNYENPSSLPQTKIREPRDFKTRLIRRSSDETVFEILCQQSTEMVIEIMQYFSMDYYVDRYSELIEGLSRMSLMVSSVVIAIVSWLTYFVQTLGDPNSELNQWEGRFLKSCERNIGNWAFFIAFMILLIHLTIPAIPAMLVWYGSNRRARRIVEIGEYFTGNR